MEISNMFMEPKRKLFRMSTPDDNKLLCFCSPHVSILKIETPPTFTENDMDAYLKFLDENQILQMFFREDKCCRLADKYLIAMVFNYFIRSGYSHLQFTAYNFFVALYLAHDIEEDEEDLKSELFIWALGNHWNDLYQKFLTSRDELWKSIGHRAIISLSNCEKVMAVRPLHWAWQRFRSEVHAGANRTDKYQFIDGASCEDLLRNQTGCWNCCSLKFAIEKEDDSATATVGWEDSPGSSTASTCSCNAVGIEDEKESLYLPSTIDTREE